MNDTLTFASHNANKGKKVALVTVTATTGSSPATVGQMIAVLDDGFSMGTVGGGASEHYVIKKAAEAIENGDDTFSIVIDHAENGMVCGGSMEVFGNVIGNHTRLCIFGGGHIAQSLASFAADVGFTITVVEDRPEFEKHFDCAEYIVCKPNEYESIDPAEFADFAVICTRGHSTDAEAFRYCLTKKLKYIGMIGSKAKVAELFTKLQNEGVKKEALDSIYAPIGLDIANAAPAEIAIAILAEILLVKNSGKLRHKKFS